MGALPIPELKRLLEKLYHTYHRLEYRSHDPVEIVWRYTSPSDQEIAGLWAALFAWGRREIAIRKTSMLLESLSSSPTYALQNRASLQIEWRHRTWLPQDVQLLWDRLRQIYKREGSLANFFWKRRQNWEEAIAEFQSYIGSPPLNRHIGNLRRGSASKRILLWLRWMIRRDHIDPGPWEGFSPRLLYVPVDVHVSKWAQSLGLISTKSPTWRTVLRLTEVFRQISPEDPLKYDFAIVTAHSFRCPPV
ncbi:MAG: TIGR02757 family protein [Bacteroidia bacterium]|nr:TIGR02757 family protein [Bacteroidia bacterium]